MDQSVISVERKRPGHGANLALSVIIAMVIVALVVLAIPFFVQGR